ncbi:trimeric intracellular cation channel family protein [Mycobacterium sp. TNTM28]|uniref:Trimeric intracellular cation channel family protein n=1 Tax=[Mycobacterium] fortunisiensis TaxID=2600579 RepID=A0ABS6KV94_9MYCO|nr:trimeric intracellular cation channel family protein [[Mycobacterium] fortunisiensis]MBU9767151.1 trimeric intracellular cation channel family protein [[Mycobacterium] fortunisiensis]
MLQLVLNYLGIAMFASSGAMVAIRKGFDLFGIAALGILTGVGGGVVRDVFLGIHPPTSIQHWPNITVAVVATAVATLAARHVIRFNRIVLTLDAVGMGFFATSGAAIAADRGASWFAAVLVGLTTAIGGGIIRDVLVREIPLLMRPDDLYAVPALIGATTYAVIDYFGPQWVGLTVGTVLATVLRLAGLVFGWRLPTGPQDLIVGDP